MMTFLTIAIGKFTVVITSLHFTKLIQIQTNENIKKYSMDMKEMNASIGNIGKRLAHLEGYIERDILDKVRTSKPTGS